MCVPFLFVNSVEPNSANMKTHVYRSVHPPYIVEVLALEIVKYIHDTRDSDHIYY